LINTYSVTTDENSIAITSKIINANGITWFDIINGRNRISRNSNTKPINNSIKILFNSFMLYP